MIKAKKSLGQNFLKDVNIQNKIFDITNEFSKLYPTLKGIEIGAGHGDLTHGFVKTFKDLIIYEIDDDIIELLKNKFPNNVIHHQDFMKVIPNLDMYLLVSNLPYYIGSRLIIDLIAYNNFSPFIFIMQKEVAMKLKSQNDLTFFGACISIFYDTKVEFIIPPQAFKPSPKVYSALVTAKPIDTDYNGLESVSILKAMFFKPNKTLFNNLIFGGFLKEDIANIFEKKQLAMNTRVNWNNYKEIFDTLYYELQTCTKK
jgi:16S rRNA (adenine1518-N6/adenine1519-N6)-dimethyltransferase